LHMFAINSDSSLKLAFLFWIICPYLVKLNLGELYEMKVQAGDNVCVRKCVCVCVCTLCVTVISCVVVANWVWFCTFLQLIWCVLLCVPPACLKTVKRVVICCKLQLCILYILHTLY